MMMAIKAYKKSESQFITIDSRRLINKYNFRGRLLQLLSPCGPASVSLQYTIYWK